MKVVSLSIHDHSVTSIVSTLKKLQLRIGKKVKSAPNVISLMNNKFKAKGKYFADLAKKEEKFWENALKIAYIIKGGNSCK